ncbi:response regulator [Rhizobium sp.]|uniref:response regulator n=1 Tax=Rhizobium sp. TaxID=391 RepID=UPI00289DB924
MEYSVLVVEDEVLIRFVAVDSLEDEGWTVYEAGSALEAVGMLSSHPEIDVVFTDVDMPGGMSGLDLARLIANIHPEIGIIVTSGRYYAAENDLPPGARFLSKPYSLSALVESIRHLTPQMFRKAGA